MNYFPWDPAFITPLANWLALGGKRLVIGSYAEGPSPPGFGSTYANRVNTVCAALGVSMRQHVSQVLLTSLWPNNTGACFYSVPAGTHYLMAGLTSGPRVCDFTTPVYGPPVYQGVGVINNGQLLATYGGPDSLGIAGPGPMLAVERLATTNSEVVVFGQVGGVESGPALAWLDVPFWTRLAEAPVP